MRQNAIISCLLLLFHNVCCNHDDWVESNAWATDQFNHRWTESCQCPPQMSTEIAVIEDKLALMYFKKFVNTLFNPNEMKYSRKSRLFMRSLLFTLRQSQIDELKAVQDVRDLDILLTTILDEATEVPLFLDYNDYIALIIDKFKDFVQFLKIREVRFVAIVLLVIVFGWSVKKQYGYSTLGIIASGVFLFGYFRTYLECNREAKNNYEKQWFSKIFIIL
ncbi:uncharacterized protein LOC116805834 isoform X2 [Drosophila grimshawi]|nr:uncharacterized protein LOC116805834 isoform X2 [Drosophila grimshawi]